MKFLNICLSTVVLCVSIYNASCISEDLTPTEKTNASPVGKNDTGPPVPSPPTPGNITTTTVAPTTPNTTTTTISPNTTVTTPTTPVTTTTTTTAAPNVTSTTTVTPSTPAPNVTTPTPAPTTTPKPTTVLPSAPTSPAPQDRSFDGLSFIGGMVLAVGMLAIGVVAFKFYRARGEHVSYFTL